VPGDGQIRTKFASHAACYGGGVRLPTPGCLLTVSQSIRVPDELRDLIQGQLGRARGSATPPPLHVNVPAG